MSSYSYTSSESTTSLLRSESTSRKDYSGALASLQSSYGFGGVSAPAPISLPAKARREPTANVSGSSPTTRPNLDAKKDYSGALANLQTSYGFADMPASTLPSSQSGRRA